MKLSDLQLFVDIVEAGGLTAAAHRRGVTQPGLSRTLREIETRMETQLLSRTGRGVELTPAGEDFLSFATETLAHFERTRQAISQRATAFPNELRLSVPLRVGQLLIPDLYRAFAERFPDSSVHVFEEQSDRARALLAENRLDAALTYRHSARSDRDFAPLFAEALCAVGHTDALGTGQSQISMADLGRLPLLLPSTGRYRDLIQSAFRSAGHPFQIARELETAEGLLAFAAENEGVAILPISNVYREVARGEVTALRITDPEITRIVGVQFGAALPRHATGPLLSILRNAMKTAASEAQWRSLKRGTPAGKPRAKYH